MFPVVHFSFSCTNGFQGPYKSVLKRVSWWKNHSSMQSKILERIRSIPQCHRSTMSYCRLFPSSMNGSNLLSLNYLLLQGKYFGPISGTSFEICFGLHRGCREYLRKKDGFFNFAISLYPLVDMAHLFSLYTSHTHPSIQGIAQQEEWLQNLCPNIYLRVITEKKNRSFSTNLRRLNCYFWILTIISVGI